MAAAEVSTNPHTTTLIDDNLDQEETRARAASTDSIDNELDWLIQNETQNDASQQDADTQEMSNISRSESRLEEERQDTDGNRGESPRERAETPDSAIDASNFEEDTETDEYYALASEQALVQQELQKLKDEGIIPQSDEPVFDYDIAERVKQLNAELAQEGATPEKKNRRVNFSDNLVQFSPSPDFNGEDQESGTPRTGEGDQPDPNDLEVEKLTLTDEQVAQEDAKRQKEQSESQRSNGSDVSASGEHSSEAGLPADNELDKLGPEGERNYVNGATRRDNESDLQAGNSNNSQVVGDMRYGGESNEQDQPTPRGGDNEQVLLERNGKFELVNVKDLSSEERVMMGLDPANTQDQNSNNSAAPASSSSVMFQPSPPARKQRPSTATEHLGVRRQQLPPRRIQSAKTHRETNSRDSPMQSSTLFDWEARSSGYGMSAEQKAAMRKMYRMRLQQQKEEQEREEEEKKRAQEESQKAFHWWVEKKREEDKQRRKEEKEKKKKEQEQETKDPESVFQAWVLKKRQLMLEDRLKARKEKMKSPEQESTDHDPEEAYKSWLQNKKEQAKVERKVKRRMEEEKEGAFYVRDRRECDQAFKEWLRSKNSQLREDKSMKRTTAAYSQKTAKLSRKSRQLAKALQIAQAYRYTEYYGYRF